ncbi:uncharacterized protein LOC117136783 isoform X1 [Drosophila mauritiana]|uniref:Uncharacterized protein LOC117136783 isoform X1 n=1 Tax=Drosophila mauritiana TaxID=7226 RepID=A0A6P8JDN3_DROMA|nr:uncharacterized protein LOC117136783 isoform X1 [Drosophila mauritiana]
MKLFQPGLELFISAIPDASVSQQAVPLHVAVAVATAVRHRRMQPAYTQCSPAPWFTQPHLLTYSSRRRQTVTETVTTSARTPLALVRLHFAIRIFVPVHSHSLSPVSPPRRHGCKSFRYRTHH